MPPGEGLKLSELQTFALNYGRTGPPPLRVDGLLPWLDNQDSFTARFPCR